MAILEKIIDKDLLGEFLSELKSMLDALQTDWGDVKSKPFSTLDGSTVESANGALQVKDGGITKAKLASDAVAQSPRTKCLMMAALFLPSQKSKTTPSRRPPSPRWAA